MQTGLRLGTIYRFRCQNRRECWTDLRIAKYQGSLNKEQDMEGPLGEGRWGCGDVRELQTWENHPLHPATLNLPRKACS